MANGQDNRPRDAWGKLSVLSGFLASVLVPIAIAVVGNWYTNAIKDRETTISERDQKIRQETFDREWVQLGLEILRDPDTKPNIRKWGVQIVSHYAEVKMEDDVKDALTAGAVLPEATAVQVPIQQSALQSDGTVATATSRTRALEQIQNRGVEALLAKDLDGAIAAYNDAYLLWPTFRNVDEIRRALIEAETTARTNPSALDWAKIYKEVEKMDLRGLPADTKQRLTQAAGS
jgi:hypothetical protein